MSTRYQCMAIACWLAGGTLAMGALTPALLEQEIAATSIAGLNERVWGLVPPELPVILMDIKAVSAQKHDMLTILPPQTEFKNGDLVFTLRNGNAVVGVGNCANKLPASLCPNFGQQFFLAVEFEQSVPGKTEWTMFPWAAGERANLETLFAGRKTSALAKKLNAEQAAQDLLSMTSIYRSEFEGTGPQVFKLTKEFYRLTKRGSFPYDGFELEIKGPKDAVITIRSIQVSQMARSGGFRKEFTLPAGKIWRAAGNVNRKTILHINGREVPNANLLKARPLPHYIYGQQLQEVDLTPFLTPGKNVIAVYPAFPSDANALLLASVVMDSGAIIDLSTDPTWQYVPARGAGWDTVGFAGTTEAITNTMPVSATTLPDTLTAIKYGYKLNMRYAHDMPAYDGRMRLQAPDDDQLYYSVEKPFRMRVVSPTGLAAEKPAIEWLLCRYQTSGPLEQVLAGNAATFTPKGDSIEFELEGGDVKIPMGIYVIKAVMRGADGRVIEDRIPEPVIVTGRLPMKPTAGSTFEEGLDLKEEAVIDFTKPDNPAFPWMEIDAKQMYKKPIVVTRNGLTYRETRPSASDFTTQVLITYNYEFKRPGDFYLMKMEYPDDQPRFFGVSLCSEHDGTGDHAGPSVWTGIWHLNTGVMQELTWLFRPDPGFTAINLINMLPGSTAAASKLRIFHVTGALPELKTAGSARHFGFLTESSRSFSGFGITFRSSAKPQTATETVQSLGLDAGKTSPLKTRLDAFTEWLDTCNHYTEYLRWAGQNVIFLGFFMYDGDVPNAEPVSVTGDTRLTPHITDLAARVFRDNGIDFFSSIEYCSDPMLQMKYETNTNMALSPFLINGEGREERQWMTGYNFNHPEVRQSMLNVAAEAVRKFKRLPNFRGVNFSTSISSPMIPPNYTVVWRNRPVDPLWCDYSDATIRRFEKDTGAKLPIPADSASRFKMRHALLTSDTMRAQWIEWRTQSIFDFFLELRDSLRAIKPDVKLATGFIGPGHFFDHAVAGGMSLEAAMREFGWDYNKFHGQEGIYTMPWLQGTGMYNFMDRYTSRNDTYEKYLKLLKANTDPAHLKIGDGALERMAMVKYCWLELERGAQQLLPKLPHWHVPYQYTMEGAEQGDAALYPFLQAMAAIDADSLVYGFTDANYAIGNEQPLREFAQFLRTLPKAKFSLLDSENKELIVRTLQQDGKFLFYALNPAPWPVQASIKVDNAGKIKNLISGKESAAPVQTLIPAYHGVSFETTGKAVISGWETSGTGEMFEKYRKHMQEKIRVTGDRLNNDKIKSVLLPAQKQIMADTLQQATQALKSQHYARAWQLLNSWDFIWCSYFLERQSVAIDLITEENPAPADLNKKILGAERTSAPPVINGKLDEAVWQKIKPQGDFVDKDGKPAQVGTTVRVAWDDNKLYLAFACRDKFPDRLKADAEREGDVLQDDSVVFLLQPNLENSHHYQMAFNSGGIKFDQKDTDYSFAPDWAAAVQVNAEGWTAEAAFPFKALEAAPAAGVKWGANFGRLFRQNQLPWSTWSYMPKNWHDPAGYGRLEFK